MDLEYNKMSLHSDLVDLTEKYEDVLTVEQTGYTMVQYGTEHMLFNSVSDQIGLWTANQAIADAIKNYQKGKHNGT